MKRALLGVLLTTALVGALPSVASADVVPVGNPASLAWFEDHWIDLGVDWEEARACDIGPAGNVCFRTEAELQQYLRPGLLRQTVFALLGTCSSSLRLYDATSYGGLVLYLSTRGVGINLSGYGWDNMTSSYRVGGCDAEFYSGSGLTGSSYPGNTSAGAQSSSMAVGWNNLVSSVIIY